MFNKLLIIKNSFLFIFKSLHFLFIILFFSCQNLSNMSSLSMHAFRLKPGQLLKEEIQKIVVEKQIKAGWISTCVGSLTQYNIRFANQPDSFKSNSHFEIVSLTGTVSINGSHLHIAISDSTGKTVGGHLLDSNIVFTTAEIVILYTNDVKFKREKDGTTDWEELQVK